MEMNFDLLISGCNTRCKHCYVNGGPGKYIPLEDALRCISRLDELASALPASPVPSFTMDNEPFNHPDIVEIIRAATSTKHIQLYHHGMTTGIALMRRKDKESVVKAYMDCGCMDFGITRRRIREIAWGKSQHFPHVQPFLPGGRRGNRSGDQAGRPGFNLFRRPLLYPASQHARI